MKCLGREFTVREKAKPVDEYDVDRFEILQLFQSGKFVIESPQ
jgi:hypothetical protein